MTEGKRNFRIGTRNPYALAEMVQGKKIDWKKKSYDRTVMTLENTFAMPVERLFNPDPRFKSPVYWEHIEEVLPDLPLFGSSESTSNDVDPDAPYGDYIKAAGMEGVDPAQSGLLLNCNLIAAMASCAWTGKGPWYKYVTAGNDPVQSSYSLQFYDYNKRIPSMTCSSNLPQSPLGTLSYAKSTTINECWPGIIEKGYYQAREWCISGTIPTMPDFLKFNGTVINPTLDPPTVLYQLLSANPNKKTDSDSGYDYLSIFNHLVSLGAGRLPNRKISWPAVAWSYASPKPGWVANTIVPQHTYSILGVTGSGNFTTTPVTWTTRYILLRDPYTVWKDPAFPSTDVLTTGIWYGIDLTKSDGIFALRADLFPLYFQGYAWAVC